MKLTLKPRQQCLHIDCRFVIFYMSTGFGYKTVALNMYKEVEHVRLWLHVDRLHSVCRHAVENVNRLRLQVERSPHSLLIILRFLQSDGFDEK
jgi:hypothetical protein